MLVEKSCSRSDTLSCAVKLESALKTRPSRDSLEQVADNDFRKQLELLVSLYKLGRTLDLDRMVRVQPNCLDRA